MWAMNGPDVPSPSIIGLTGGGMRNTHAQYDVMMIPKGNGLKGAECAYKLAQVTKSSSAIKLEVGWVSEASGDNLRHLRQLSASPRKLMT